MFEKKELVYEAHRANNPAHGRKSLPVLIVCLMSLLVASPLFATDPIDLDPDPDLTVPAISIVLDESERAKLDDLPPGHYLVTLIAADGSQQTFDLWVE